MWTIQPMTLNDISCNLGTELSLGLNCYCTGVYICTKTNTRSRSASATDAAKYLICIYSDFEYQYTALPIVFIALRQRVTSEDRTIRGFQEWQPIIHTVPYLYSSTHNCHKALKDIPESVHNIELICYIQYLGDYHEWSILPWG